MRKLNFRYYPEPPTEVDKKLEKRKFWLSQVLPALFIVIIWLVKFSEFMLNNQFTQLGIYPGEVKGLIGIFTGPLVHSDINHLWANSASFYVLASALFYFYRKHALQIFIFNYIITGILLWAIGRESWHIGASGIVYGLASFLFFSGVFRNDLRLLTISLIVAFLYGSLLWGLFPVDPKISWEGHLSGAITGLVLSAIYKKHGPQRRQFEWEKEEESEEELTNEEVPYWKVNSTADYVNQNHDNEKQN